MRTSRPVNTPAKQKGLVLLILVIIIMLGFAAYALSGLSVNQLKAEQKKQTSIALKKAKQALISYALSFPEITAADRGPGYLPCPDLDNNGKSTPNDCKTLGVPNVGRLPWSTLGIDELTDGAGESLWYAVSENYDYSNSPTIYKINTATAGTLTVRDNNAAPLYDGAGIDAAIAVIIAPGSSLTRDDGVAQNRTAANINSAINYLDIDVASGEDNISFQHGTLDGFIQGEVKNAAGDIIVNDRIEVITYRDLMDQVHKRVAREISNLINSYFFNCGLYPEASAFDPTKATFISAGQGSTTELNEGHLPFDNALPVNWGDICSQSGAAVVNAPVPLQWLIDEGWHKVSYYKFAYTNPLFPYPASPAPVPVGIPCTQGVDCLSANNSTLPVDQSKTALIIFAGRDTTGNRPSSVITDYFEAENSDTDLIFNEDEIEDYVGVIWPQ